MTDNTHTTISGMLDIAQSIPALLGYAPTGRVAVLGTSGQVFKACGTYECPTAAHSSQAATELLSAMTRQGVTSIAALSYDLDAVTAARAMRELRARAADAGIIVTETARIAHGRIWVGHERGAGQPMPQAPEAGATALQVHHGAPATSREELAATWKPTGHLTPDSDVTHDQGAAVWSRLLDGQTLTESEQCRALGYLTTTSGRNVVSFAVGPFMDDCPDDLRPHANSIRQQLKGSPLSEPLERLRQLVTACSHEHAADLVAVAGLLAWTGGNGTVAAICVMEAENIEPGHKFARLLYAALINGISAPVPR